MITVDIWSDIVCPFCYIGKRRLENAIKKLTLNNQVKITWHSFQLDPNFQRSSEDENYVQHLSQKKGINEDQVKLMMERVTYTAKEMGLNYQLLTSKPANTNKAHQLLQLAKSFGLANEVKENVMHAHFILNEDLEQNETLLKCIDGLEIKKEEALLAITNKTFQAEIEADQALAQKLGITGVPFFVVNNKYGISGAQEQQVFEDCLKKIG